MMATLHPAARHRDATVDAAESVPMTTRSNSLTAINYLPWPSRTPLQAEAFQSFILTRVPQAIWRAGYRRAPCTPAPTARTATPFLCSYSVRCRRSISWSKPSFPCRS